VTRATQALDHIEPEPLEAVAPTAPDPLEPPMGQTPCWPVTRLGAWSLTLLLGMSILGPATIGRAHRIEWLALLLPATVATVGARALFETLGSAGGARRVLGHATAAVLPTLMAVGLMAVASAIVGVGWSPLLGGTTAVLTMLTLVTAGAMRDVEIRLRLSLRRVYFIGSHDSRGDLARELSRRHDARLVGARALRSGIDPAGVVEAVLAARATVLVLDRDAMRVPELVDAASRLNLAGVRVRDLVSYYEAEFKKVPLAELSPTWFLFDIASIHRSRVRRALRRAVETALAAVLLLVTLPLLLLVGMVIRLTSPGPVLYRQSRVGKAGAAFMLLKLRTMTEATDPDELDGWPGPQTHRITPIGRLLRRFRLDELPQLWNVIRGDLALIGPRPERPPIVERFDRELQHYSARHCIRPGITGWAQVHLGYAASVEETVTKLQGDLYYIKHKSLRLDGLILWLTLKTVIAGRG
jgi:lipopolysaccharide/colanic/teichoic acid biosynthesis glycosyltransferase